VESLSEGSLQDFW